MHDVKELGFAADLLKVGLAEGILQDHIEDGLGNWILIIDKFLIQESRGLCAFINNNSTGFALIWRLHINWILDRLHGEDHTARGRVRAQHPIDVPMFGCKDFVDYRGIKHLIG